MENIYPDPAEAAANARMQLLQKKLTEAGLVSINFAFAPGFEQAKHIDLMNEVYNFLDLYLEGKYKPVDRIEETPLEEAILADFYGAKDRQELIHCQATHVRKLQMKLDKYQKIYNPHIPLVERVREG